VRADLLRHFRSCQLRRRGTALLAAAAAAFPSVALTQAAPATNRAGLLGEAEQAIAEGRSFAATRLLAPLLTTPTGREPAVILLAARAAAGWEGWGSVVRLLAQQSWLDELDGGEGRALLARARVERGQAPLDDARRALATAHGDALGPRLVTLARAFDRADLRDSAAATYLRAEALLPSVGDWLRLRAAGVLADSTVRSKLYRLLTLPAAVNRVRWTEALALDRNGEWSAAARQYEALGASVAAARLHLRAARNPAELATVRRELVTLLAARPSATDARDAIDLLEQAFPRLTPTEELLIARRSATADPARAVKGFGRAAAAPAKLLSEADRLSYGSVLARVGRHHDAMVQLDAVRSPELKPQAQYLRARSLLASGARNDAIAALRQVFLFLPQDSATAATAGFLLGDLLVDDGEESGARQAYLDVARRFPRTSHGARAAFQAALLAWVHGQRSQAAQEFAALAERAGETTEGIAALYWSGRALFAAGDSAAAAACWRSLLERFPSSYYTVPAAERLGAAAVREPPPAIIASPDNAVTAALERAALLERLGLRVEARFEYDRLSRQAESSPALQLPTARAFSERGLLGRSFRLALRGAELVPQQLAFPLPDAQTLEEARRAGVDPLLTAALIRQESAFDPSARSRADARGLMQVLPSVGAGMAPSAGISDWDPALLYQPEVNVHFGVAHLAQTLRRYPVLPVALATYNAGERPTTRWLALPGAADDPEVFIERIQFVETRDYVRRIVRNLAVYRAFYPVPLP
jgi:soluble lytic murein transglycosylase